MWDGISISMAKSGSGSMVKSMRFLPHIAASFNRLNSNSSDRRHRLIHLLVSTKAGELPEQTHQLIAPLTKITVQAH
jgi:hypothetical protein